MCLDFRVGFASGKGFELIYVGFGIEYLCFPIEFIERVEMLHPGFTSHFPVHIRLFGSKILWKKTWW